MISGLAKYAAGTLIPAHRDGLQFLENVIQGLMKHGKPKDDDAQAATTPCCASVAGMGGGDKEDRQ
jgi:hypothetical protein